MKKYDIVIIGSGPGGYIAAIRASQLGFKTAIIEKYSKLGGTCLNVGCIPSKTLLESSEHYYQAKTNFLDHGIIINNLSIDFQKLLNRKQQIIHQLANGIKYLIKKNNIDLYYGIAEFKEKNLIAIKERIIEKELIKFQYAIIATGSKPNIIPPLYIDKQRFISSTEALSLNEIPKKLIIIGGGVIGVELGSIYNKLGSEVIIIEYQNRIIPMMDHDLSKELQIILEKTGIKFFLSSQIIHTNSNKNKVNIYIEDINKEKINLTADYCLITIGRIPFTTGLNLEQIGIKKNKMGFIIVDDKLKTNINHIYAIGDVIGGNMLAHKAEEEALYVIEQIAGQQPYLNYQLIPSVIYTHPEVASVGNTENYLKNNNIPYKIGKMPIKILGRAISSGKIEGFIKIITNLKTDEILGVHMICARASDMIMEAVIAMEFHASAEDISRICHPHPTFTEAIKEAALLAYNNKAIHI